jgi:hypothetical protein
MHQYSPSFCRIGTLLHIEMMAAASAMINNAADLRGRHETQA